MTFKRKECETCTLTKNPNHCLIKSCPHMFDDLIPINNKNTEIEQMCLRYRPVFDTVKTNIGIDLVFPQFTSTNIEYIIPILANLKSKQITSSISANDYSIIISCDTRVVKDNTTTESPE